MIFVDTGAFLARYHKHDQYHVGAVEKWRKLADSGLKILTSVFVINETVTLMARRLSYPFAVETARNIFSSKEIEILRPDEELETESLLLFEKYADSEITFTDALSAALMRRHKIKRVFGFDRHFTQMGFELF